MNEVLENGGSPSPKIQIGDWFNEAWKAFQEHWLEAFLISLVYYIATIFLGAFCILPLVILGGPLLGGLYIHAAKALKKQPIDFNDLFKGFRKFKDLLLVYLTIFGIPTLVGMIFFMIIITSFLGLGASQDLLRGIGGFTFCIGTCTFFVFVLLYPILVGTYLFFVFPLILFDGMSFSDAMKTSINMVKPHFFKILLVLIVIALLLFIATAIGSVIPIIGGLLLTPPALYISIMLIIKGYEAFFGLNEEKLQEYVDTV